MGRGLMKRNWLIVSFGALAPLVCVDSLNAEVVSCQVVVERDTLLVAEPIWVDVKVINLSRAKLESWCFSQFPIEGCFELKGPNGALMPYSGFHIDLGGVASIEAGQTWTMTYNLLDHFGESYLDPPRHLGPGSYEVSFVCEGNCRSELDRFVIVQPSGTEKLAYELFALGEKRSANSGTANSSIEIYESVLTNYPASRFAPLALNSLISVLRLSGRYDQAISQCQRFIANWPNDGHTRSLLTTILYHTETREAGIDRLRVIIADHPNTRVGRFASERLELIQSGRSRLWDKRHLRIQDGMRGERK